MVSFSCVSPGMSVNHISTRVEAAFNFGKRQVKAALAFIGMERNDLLFLYQEVAGM